MNEGVAIADASAILALLKQEPFSKLDPRRLFRATISAVNLSEVLERLCSGGLSEREAEEAVAELNLEVADFDEAQARLTAYLRRGPVAPGSASAIAPVWHWDCTWDVL